MSDIFVSYAREDFDRIMPLVQALEGAGWLVFWDRTIPAGRTWRQVIEAEIDGCRCMIVIWSKKSIESDWVLEEADEGKRRNILVPVFIEDVLPPIGFRSIQAANLDSWNGTGPNEAFERLVIDISRLLGKPQEAQEKKRQVELEASRKAEEEAARAREKAAKEAEEQQQQVKFEAKLEAKEAAKRTHETETSMIGNIIGNLRIISEIGKGGMGVVYLAEHVKLPRRFAVKCLAPELTQEPHFRDIFYQEAKNQALLDHPNIVKATDFIETDDQFFLVMDYVYGQDIGKLIEKKGRLSEKEALHIIKDVLEGLNFAHKKGIIHRDIKPSNILIDSDDRARIIDFGIAILAGSKRLTQTGATVGFPWYMSPEQIVQPKDIDHRSDVYSAGIVLYEMLTGEVPFDGKSDYTVINLHINSPIPNPRQNNPNISPELTKIIFRALQKKPEDRFPGCAQFLKTIEEIERPSPPPTPSRLGRIALFTIAVVSIGVAIYIFFIRQPIIQQQIGEKETKLQQEKAYNIIQSASEKGLIICHDLIRYKFKKDALDTAKKISDHEMIDKFNKLLQDHERNIKIFVPEYNELILNSQS